jgi:hypothetical protein
MITPSDTLCVTPAATGLTSRVVDESPLAFGRSRLLNNMDMALIQLPMSPQMLAMLKACENTDWQGPIEVEGPDAAYLRNRTAELNVGRLP